MALDLTVQAEVQIVILDLKVHLEAEEEATERTLTSSISTIIKSLK